MSSHDLEAKIVVLGAQGVGKTSLLNRFIHSTFLPPTAQPPTIGATFLTKRLPHPSSDHPGSSIRLQIWDTAGQERFRSISKLYYRGANAAILCYDITDARSFAEMGNWLTELREYNSGCLGPEGACVVHVVGTKADVVAENPRARQVPFEQCITFVAEQLHGLATPSALNATTAPSTPRPGAYQYSHTPLQAASVSSATTTASSPGTLCDPRGSGFWGQDTAWDSCHEISAKDGEGVEEVFRVIVRKLVEQQGERRRGSELGGSGEALGMEGGSGGYFDRRGELGDGRGSFRVGIGDKRRSWLGFPTTPGVGTAYDGGFGGGVAGDRDLERKKGGRCC